MSLNPAAGGLGAALSFLPGTGLVCAYADSFQGTVKATTLNVRAGAGTTYRSVGTLANGSAVTVLSETTGSDGNIWYQISYGSGQTGYVRSDFIRRNAVYSASDADFESWMTSQGFPESYKNDLRGLHEAHPSWVFYAQRTGLDWNTVLSEESRVGRNLVHQTSKSSWKSTAQGAFDWASNSWPGFDGASWQAASTEIIAYYMDPRNFLSEPYIFQFELQSYNAATQTRDGLAKIVSGTFLAQDVLVPLEGSVIEGGTIVEAAAGSTAASGSVSGSTGSSGSGAQSAGPGSTGTTSIVSGGSTLSAGPGVSTETGSTAATTSSAAWVQDQTGWWYRYEDGSYPRAGWYWIDGNRDGIAECYYFNDNGYLVVSTEIDGYPVNADGQWIHHDGTVYTQAASDGYGASSTASGATVQMKQVSYLDILMKAAETSGVSPYVLASMIIQEQGTEGTSDLISGTRSGYEGYYNFFNLGAYEHDGMSAVEAGLAYAAETGNGDRPWNSVEKAIIGGASAYGANYVQNGQDTFYLKKFNVQGTNLYNHQYMTNVPAAANEGAKVSDAYSSEVKATALSFRIPVYENMPESPAVMPTKDGNPNNKLSAIEVAGYTLSPAFSMDTESYTLTVDSTNPVITVTAQTIDQGAGVSGAGTVTLSAGQNTVSLVVTAENGDTRTYTLQITYTGDGSGGTGSAETGSVSAGDSGSTIGVTPVPDPSGSAGTTTTDGTSDAQSGTAPDGSNVIIIG